MKSMKKRYKMDDSWGVLWEIQGNDGCCRHDFGTCPPIWPDGWRISPLTRANIRDLTPPEELQFRLEGWL